MDRRSSLKPLDVYFENNKSKFIQFFIYSTFLYLSKCSFLKVITSLQTFEVLVPLSKVTQKKLEKFVNYLMFRKSFL